MAELAAPEVVFEKDGLVIGLANPEVDVEKGRPMYECPECHQLEMQFFHTDPSQSDREDSFICRACGRSWEV